MAASVRRLIADAFQDEGTWQEEKAATGPQDVRLRASAAALQALAASVRQPPEDDAGCLRDRLVPAIDPVV
jgi:hypothetical protein